MTQYIKDMFSDEHIETEYTGFGLRFNDTNALMKFDAAIPALNVVFEYQGEQHFDPIEAYGGKKGFNRTIERDRQKRLACSNEGFVLIEIPYTWDQSKIYIENILEKQNISFERRYLQKRINEYC